MNKLVVAAIAGAALLAGASCSRNPITGRNQLTLVSEKQVQALALTEYQKFLTTNTVVPATNANGEMVRRVGQRIADAIGTYYADHGSPDALKGYSWEFNLVESKEINAWCMPGGKVVVYTGLLPVTQNETALAIVLGGQKPPILLSDHPADSNRINKLQELMPEALTYYKGSKAQ